MWRKLTKLITNNFGLKILAACFAVVLWLVVVNTEDPEKTRAFSIPVSIENVDYLTDMGKTYEILNNTDRISFTVTGKRSIIEELSESDFTATANMENINEDMSKIPVTVSASRYASHIEISKKDSYMQISVENLVTEQFKIETVLTGTPAENCYVEKTRVVPEKVTVTGPESVVEQIASVQVTVNVDRIEENLATNGDIVLLNADGDVISQERLTLNRTTAAVDVVVMMGKSIPIEYETTGEPAAGYRFVKVDSSVSNVNLTGPTEILDSLENLKISSSRLNMDGANKDFKVVISLSDYLPEGVSLADGEPTEIEVTVRIEGQETKSFAMPVENVTVEGLADNLELQFDAATITVNLMGFTEELEAVSASELRGTLDASSLQAGTSIAVIKLQGDYKIADTVRTTITVTERESDTADGETNSSEQGSTGSAGGTGE